MNAKLYTFLSAAFFTAILGIFGLLFFELKPGPVSDDERAKPRPLQPVKVVLQLDCKQAALNVERCRNEEVICYNFGPWGQCFQTNKRIK